MERKTFTSEASSNCSESLSGGEMPSPPLSVDGADGDHPY